MKAEFEKFLKDTYPLLYRYNSYGFECSDGWFDLLNNLSADIQKHIDKQIEEADPNVCSCGCYKDNHEGGSGKCNNKFINRTGDLHNCFCKDFHLAVARAVQVKEKFGSLRFYMENSTKEISDLVREAENKSYSICEECGNPGQIRKGGWIRCLCDDHAKGREAIKTSLEDI